MIIYGHNLLPVYAELARLGLTESERRFGQWLGVTPQYLRDHRRAAGRAKVNPRTARRLRRQLVEFAQRLTPGLRREVEAISVRLERDAAVAEMLVR